MQALGYLIRQFFSIFLGILFFMGVFSFIFQALHPEIQNPTEKRPRYDRQTGIEVNSEQAKIYSENVEKLIYAINDNTSKMQAFLIEAGFSKEAEYVTEPKMYLAGFGKKYTRITPNVWQDFIDSDYNCWLKFILPMEKNWDCEQWQNLKREHDFLLKQAEELEKTYSTIPRIQQ